MKKILEEMILKCHADGITLDETARLVPQDFDRLPALPQAHENGGGEPALRKLP